MSRSNHPTNRIAYPRVDGRISGMQDRRLEVKPVPLAALLVDQSAPIEEIDMGQKGATLADVAAQEQANDEVQATLPLVTIEQIAS